MPIFNKLGKAKPQDLLTKQVENIRSFLQSNRSVNKTVSGYAIGAESLDDSKLNDLSTAVQSLKLGMENLAREFGYVDVSPLDGKQSLGMEALASQMDAAVAGGILAGDPQMFLGMKIQVPTVPQGHKGKVVTSGFGIEDMVSNRMIGVEAYDERDNRDAAVYSIAYNMNASRQDDFGEAFFPTIVVTPDNVGFAITARLIQVYNDFTRDLSGDLANYNKQNIIRALEDPTILKNEMTRIIPVVRAQNTAKFVASTLVGTTNMNLEGEVIPTAPLAAGVELDLLAMSQTDALLEKGTMDTTDSIDPGSLKLQNIYIKVGADVLKISTENLPLSSFNFSVQDNYRIMALDFQSDSVILSADTTNADGSALQALGAIKTNQYSVRIKVAANGKINTERGDTHIYGPAPTVYMIVDSNGNNLDLGSGAAKTIVDAFAGASVIGYDVYAYRTNANRRQRGQLIDTTYYSQVYNVPLRSPITAIHPVTTDGQTDSSDLNSLITATRIRTSNQAVGALINAQATLKPYKDVPDAAGVWPDVLGVGRFYVKPTYYEENIDMLQVVDSLKSSERRVDIQEALVNKLRVAAYNGYRDTQYKAAAEALAGGVARTPEVIIGTDPVIARWLNVTGDLRTLGGEFDCRLVTTLDRRVKGKIFLTFGVFDESRNTAPNPLNFGNMAWSPEVTVVLPISRGGQVSKETAVQPRFLHIVNLPFLAVFNVSNLDQVTDKVTLNVSK
jgi:hypothetical protein